MHFASLLNQTPIYWLFSCNLVTISTELSCRFCYYRFSENISHSDVSFLPFTHPPIFASVFCCHVLSLFRPVFFCFLSTRPWIFTLSFLRCSQLEAPAASILWKGPPVIERDTAEEIPQSCWKYNPRPLRSQQMHSYVTELARFILRYNAIKVFVPVLNQLSTMP
jgi:hypothetical protein